MKQLTGIPLADINNAIIGKVTFKPVKKSIKHDFIFVEGKEKPETNYAATILTERNHSMHGFSILCNPRDVETLSDGDIIAIEPNGNINVLYEKNSIHNALFVTERCNCYCIMCPQPPVAKEEEKTSLILKIISLIDEDAQTLGITGGEPTLLGEQLIEIITTCKQRLPKTKLIILTNGIRLEDFDFVKKLMMIKHPDLTIDIPLHSDTDTEHNKIARVNGFYKTIQGLYNLARFSQKIGLRIVMHGLNYKRLPSLAEFIYHNFPFVSHIAFMQMETFGLARDNLESVWIDPYNYNEQLEKAVTYLWRRGMGVSIYNAQLCVIPKSLWKYARKSISTWKNIYIDECDNCNYKNKCGGFFASSLDIHSQHIQAMKIN